ncbi:MAG: UDP-2,4-diacetamido-2,4,6-trideoxy-beta-L-altropyranose hydrolase [Candidatus Omnitrophica bacterium]|nr:UDP-2,4-diacetamido-2,4,6-trideoxy-beta-L-altropyranose hydrolase [Candidatus Omnitrophota bacterium]
MNSRIVIITEGGAKIGFGHITRCIGLYQAFQEKGRRPEFIINTDKTTRYLLNSKRYKILNWLRERDYLFDLLKGADIVIVDSYLANLSLYKKISSIVKTPVYLDDNKRLSYPRGIVVNGQVYAGGLNYPRSKDVLYYLGAKYIPLRKQFWNFSRKGINKDIKQVLVTFGGKGHLNLMNSIASIVKRRFYCSPIMVGGARKVNVKEIASLMSRADFCISGGGQTTYELARCGIPTIGISLADNQLSNLKAWAKLGFLEFAGRYNEAGLSKKISQELKGLSYKKRIRMSQIGQKAVDGQGARRLVKEILKQAESKNL